MNKSKNQKPKLPNNIDLNVLAKLLKYSDRYEISIQFWPEQIAVFIAKDGVELKDFGGTEMFSINKAIGYLDRINDHKGFVKRKRENKPKNDF